MARTASASIPVAVYPCTYREHILVITMQNMIDGLSLYIQGTFTPVEDQGEEIRFIPVHTGNI